MEKHDMFWVDNEVQCWAQTTNVCLCVCVLQFEDVELLTGHLESLLHFRDKLYRKESEVQDQVDQQRKALLTLEDKNHLMRLHKNNQLSDLRTELEKARSETLIWVPDLIPGQSPARLKSSSTIL